MTKIRQWMKQICLKKWGPEKYLELGIRFVCDAEIQKLNQKFRHQNKPTDVLSFWNRDTQKKGPHYLGDIVISVDTTIKNAKSLGNSFDDEIKYLLIHGFLHLRGYDHEISRKEEKRMQRQEKILWNYLK